MQRAWAVAQGVSLALGDGVIGPEWFDAVGMTEDQAADLEFRQNSARLEAAAKARRRGG